MTVAGPSRRVPALARAGDGPTVPRPVRAAALALVAAVLAAAGHGVTARSLPEPRLLAAGALVVFAGALVVRRRRVGFRAVAVLLAAGQVMLHTVLALCHLDPASPAGPLVHRWLCPQDLPTARWAVDPLLVAPPHPPSAHVHVAAVPLGDGFLAHLVPSPGMAAGHLLAALVTAWWLARGEAAALAVVARAGRRVLVALTGRTSLVAVPARVLPVPVCTVVPPVQRVAFAAAHGRRGPPAVLTR